jgi:hypothetical protein
MMPKYLLVNMVIEGCGFVVVIAGTGDWNPVNFQTPINLSAWANADGTANRNAKEIMQAIIPTRVFIEPPLGTVVRRAGGNSTDITSPEFRLLLRNNGLNIETSSALHLIYWRL